MIKGTTAGGFEFEIEPEAINDMEFLERLGDASEDVTKMPKIMTDVLGAEGRKKLYDFVRTDSGRVPIVAAIELFQEVLTIANESNEGKN